LLREKGFRGTFGSVVCLILRLSTQCAFALQGREVTASYRRRKVGRKKGREGPTGKFQNPPSSFQ